MVVQLRLVLFGEAPKGVRQRLFEFRAVGTFEVVPGLYIERLVVRGPGQAEVRKYPYVGPALQEAVLDTERPWLEVPP